MTDLLTIEDAEKEVQCDTEEVLTEVRESKLPKINLSVSIDCLCSIKEAEDLVKDLKETIDKITDSTDFVFDSTKSKKQNVMEVLQPFQQVLALSQLVLLLERHILYVKSVNYLCDGLTVNAWEQLSQDGQFLDDRSCKKLQDSFNEEVGGIKQAFQVKSIYKFAKTFCDPICNVVGDSLSILGEQMIERDIKCQEEYEEFLERPQIVLSKTISEDRCVVEYGAAGFSIEFEEERTESHGVS